MAARTRDPQLIAHGRESSYRNYGCKCDQCRQAKAEKDRGRPRKGGTSRRTGLLEEQRERRGELMLVDGRTCPNELVYSGTPPERCLRVEGHGGECVFASTRDTRLETAATVIGRAQQRRSSVPLERVTGMQWRRSG